MTLYEWLVLGHILAAIVWVGGGIMDLMVSRRIAASGEPIAEKAFTGVQAWTGARVFGPAAVSVLVFGFLLVWRSDAWTFGQPWVWLSLILTVAMLLTGALYFGPEAGRIEKLADERGVDDAEVRRRTSRAEQISNLEVVVMVVVVFLMVFKPGA